MRKGQRYSVYVSVGWLSLFLFTLLLSSCSLTGGRDPHEVLYWTSMTDPVAMDAQQTIIKVFEQENPDLHVRMVSMPSASAGDATALITAVRGGSPPDVYLLDRFAVNQLASIGLLTNLAPYIAREKSNLAQNYLPFAWNETIYQGNPYALPIETDARVLYYNKDLLRQAGIDPDLFDPAHGPITIDTLMALAHKVDKFDARGNYTQMGFIPWAGQGQFATWSLDFGAKYFDAHTCQLTLTEPAILQTYQYFAQWAKELNYAQVDTFLATYQPPNAPPGQAPFLTGHLALSIDGNWITNGLRLYAPTLNYGVASLPVIRKGDQSTTWSGGFALAVPTGAPNAGAGYRFMRFMTGEEGQRIFVHGTGDLPTWASLYHDKQLFAHQPALFQQIIPSARSRVPLPVGAQLWDAMTTAQEEVLLGEETPRQALDEAQSRVQPIMQQYCPFASH
jgi:ABC-type glycerol-3-phosphate transport system substrate-binding protein